MNKEIIKALCWWMGSRHGVELARVRVGENQTSRYGSMSRQGDGKFRISVSNYPDIITRAKQDQTNKIRILETIVHEFAHIVLFSNGDTKAKHGTRFVDTLHDLLVSDWQEIVRIYNFLAQDDLDNDIDLVWELADDQSFSKIKYTEARRRYADNKDD